MMTKGKVLLSAVAVTGTVIALGVYRLVDEDQLDTPSTGAAMATAPARAPRAAESATGAVMAPGTGTATATDPFGAASAAESATGAALHTPAMGGPAGARPGEDARTRGLEAGAGDEARRPPGPDDPGRHAWRVAAQPRETRVERHRYREPQAGQRTILTSGRRIGAPSIRLPRQVAPAGEQNTVRALVCVNPRGRPTEVRIADGTGRPKLDASVARELLTDRFRPLRRDGRRVPFCEEVTVVVST